MVRVRGMLAIAVALGAPAATVGCLGTTDTGGCSPTIPVHAYNIGDVVSDSLTAQTCRQLYQFTATAQVNVRLKISSPTFQTFLQLVDQRSAIVMNSALTSSLDTTTTVRLMLGAGTYAISVNAVNLGQSGAYQLTSAVDSAAVAGCAAIWVTSGVTTTQTITTGDCTQGPAGTAYLTHQYAMVLLVGQEVTITEASTTFTPGIVLTGQGSTIPSTLDPGGTSASISTIIGTQGAYSIWAGSSSTGQTGPYTLQIQ